MPPPCVRASLPPGPPRRRPCARVGAPCGCVSLDKGSETHPLFPHTPPPPPEAWSSLEARVWRAASAASAPNDDPLVAATGARCPLRRARQPSGDTGVGGASAVGRRPRQRFEATSASRRRRRATVRKGSGGPFPPPHVLFSCTSFLAHMRGPSDAASPRGHAQTPFCSRWSHYLTPLCGPSPPLKICSHHKCTSWRSDDCSHARGRRSLHCSSYLGEEETFKHFDSFHVVRHALIRNYKNP